jgi:hypothetical protein
MIVNGKRKRHHTTFDEYKDGSTSSPVGDIASDHDDVTLKKTIKQEISRHRLDFRDFRTLHALTSATLKHYFGLNHWSIMRNSSSPDGRLFLCPPIPQRLEYVLWIARELLGGWDSTADGQCLLVPRRCDRGSVNMENNSLMHPPCQRHPSLPLRGLDIGIGANCIYSLLFTRLFSNIEICIIVVYLYFYPVGNYFHLFFYFENCWLCNEHDYCFSIWFSYYYRMGKILL